MKMEQLKNAIEKIDDKYISEAEYFDPETMKIPGQAVPYTLPAAAVAASVALIVVTSHFTDFKHVTDNFEINNGFEVTDNTTVSETILSETSENTANYITEASKTDAFSESSVNSAVTGSFYSVTAAESVSQSSVAERVTDTGVKETASGKTSVKPESSNENPVSSVTAAEQTVASDTLFITDEVSVSSENEITTVVEMIGPATIPVINPDTEADTDKPESTVKPVTPSLLPGVSRRPEESEEPGIAAPSEPNLTDIPTDIEIPDTELPVSSNASPLQYRNYAQLTEDIKNYNPDKFPAVYRNAYEKMFERINSDGFLYAVDDSPERPFSLTGSNILLIPASKNEDTGTSCMVEYRNSVLQVIIYYTDKNIYSSADSQKSYIENRTSLKFSNVYHIGYNDVYAGLSGTLEYAASFIDDEHYCVIITTGYRSDILDYAESSPFIKINLQ